MVAEFERGAIWLSQRNGRISSKWRSAFSRRHIGRLLIITPEIPRFVGYLAPLGSHFDFAQPVGQVGTPVFPLAPVAKD